MSRDFAGKILKIVQEVKTMQALNSETGKFFAIMCVADVVELEKGLVDSLVRGREEGMKEEELKKANEMAALLGCLNRFFHDLIDNTSVAKKCYTEYKEMRKQGLLD